MTKYNPYLTVLKNQMDNYYCQFSSNNIYFELDMIYANFKIIAKIFFFAIK